MALNHDTAKERSRNELCWLGSRIDLGWSGIAVGPLVLGSQLGKGVREYQDSVSNLFGRGIFIRAMADATTAGDEDHGGGTDLRHEQGIVIGAANHLLHFQIEMAADLNKGVDQLRIANGRRVHVQALALKIHSATAANFGDGFFNALERGVTGG